MWLGNVSLAAQPRQKLQKSFTVRNDYTPGTNTQQRQNTRALIEQYALSVYNHVSKADLGALNKPGYCCQVLRHPTSLSGSDKHLSAILVNYCFRLALLYPKPEISFKLVIHRFQVGDRIAT